MFGLENNHRYFLWPEPVSMRKSIDGLFNTIISSSSLSPMSGDVFIFFSKNRQSVKLLKWDRDGFLLYHKRLERGSFQMPRVNPGTRQIELAWETFSLIMSGINIESACFRKRFRSHIMGL